VTAALKTVAVIAGLGGVLMLSFGAGSDDIGTLPYAGPWTVLAIVMFVASSRAESDQRYRPLLTGAAVLMGVTFLVGLVLLSSHHVI
jgi:hypothetical protein